MNQDPFDAGLSVLRESADLENTLLPRLNELGFLDSTDLVVAHRIARLVGEPFDSPATLALAFAVAGVRDGSTALDLARVADVRARQDEEDDAEPPVLGNVVTLPEPEEWRRAVDRSLLAAQGVLQVDLGLVYLDRYHVDERLIAERLLQRSAVRPAPLDLDAAQVALDERARGGHGLDPQQRAAVDSVLTRTTTVLTGGPGMGKTHTIADVLRAMRAAAPTARIALAAPTGKAAARMSESLREQGIDVDAPAVTMHRLLGTRWGTSQRFRHDVRNPLPHDLVVIDEASMVSLSMMARLLEALPLTTRLLLVGDPHQLASVEAGSVLGDLVTGLGSEGGVVELVRDHRLAHARVALAQAFRLGDPDAVLAAMKTPESGITFLDTDDPDPSMLDGINSHARLLRETALAGDADRALEVLRASRLLCAHRTGPVGTRRWVRLVEQSLADVAPEVAYQEMYIGRPLLITRNDYGLGLANGDTGVIVQREGVPVAVIESTGGERAYQEFSPWRLGDVETMHAMTVHKAQGSQAEHVTVLVPPVGSRLLTREMLYTALTRASQTLTVIGTEEAVRTAVRSPVQRSSGLARRLRAVERTPDL